MIFLQPCAMLQRTAPNFLVGPICRPEIQKFKKHSFFLCCRICRSQHVITNCIEDGDASTSMAWYIKLPHEQHGAQHLKQNDFNLVGFLRWQVFLYRHYLLHVLHDIRKNKVNYSLGFFACFLVVFVVSLVVTIIGNTPIVFMRLAELQVGEVDMRVIGDYKSNAPATPLNYTLVEGITFIPSTHFRIS